MTMRTVAVDQCKIRDSVTRARGAKVIDHSVRTFDHGDRQ